MLLKPTALFEKKKKTTTTTYIFVLRAASYVNKETHKIKYLPYINKPVSYHNSLRKTNFLPVWSNKYSKEKIKLYIWGES